MRVIKCNFRKTKLTDLRKSLNGWISAKKSGLLHCEHEFSLNIQNYFLYALFNDCHQVLVQKNLMKR